MSVQIKMEKIHNKMTGHDYYKATLMNQPYVIYGDGDTPQLAEDALKENMRALVENTLRSSPQTPIKYKKST